MDPVRIARAAEISADIRSLLRELDDYLIALYPAESNHLLDVASLTGPAVRFLVAYEAGRPVGCGALLRHGGDFGEIKRMYVSPRRRKGGVGRRLLERIEDEAKSEGLSLLRLETGIHQPEAIGLYRASGYTDCAPFADYRPDPLSLFMEKRL